MTVYITVEAGLHAFYILAVCPGRLTPGNSTPDTRRRLDGARILKDTVAILLPLPSIEQGLLR
jgi:hypothetical protein